MIKKLIERYEIRKEFNLIKKHFKIAKRQKSLESLEDVTFELLDFEEKLVQNNQLGHCLTNEIFNFFAEIDYARLRCESKDSLKCDIND